jgi:hypothetical protein
MHLCHAALARSMPSWPYHARSPDALLMPRCNATVHEHTWHCSPGGAWRTVTAPAWRNMGRFCLLPALQMLVDCSAAKSV